ncbi:hypothetical protein HMPREF0569_1383 [Micrococcus luteus SK58]|nr:hypothetical protein HMPREF0569_1383 [Micrococcus luteus SK58]
MPNRMCRPWIAEAHEERKNSFEGVMYPPSTSRTPCLS